MVYNASISSTSNRNQTFCLQFGFHYSLFASLRYKKDSPERDLIINPTSLIALTLRNYCQTIVRLLSLHSQPAKLHD